MGYTSCTGSLEDRAVSFEEGHADMMDVVVVAEPCGKTVVAGMFVKVVAPSDFAEVSLLQVRRVYVGEQMRKLRQASLECLSVAGLQMVWLIVTLYLC